MLHQFLVTNKSELINRCKIQNDQRYASEKVNMNMEFGIPLFIDQLIETLRSERESMTIEGQDKMSSLNIKNSAESELRESATQHGRESSKADRTIDNLVHEYGDLCQEITKLAIERDVPIEVDEFRIFNRCLDNAIASAVTEYSYQRDSLIARRGAQAVDDRLLVLANEQRHHLRTAALSMKAIRAGNVGLNGATGAILELSLASLQRLLDRFMNGIGWSAELPARQHMIALSEFISEVKETYHRGGKENKCKLTIREVDKELTAIADADLLFMAVGALLQNSFKSVLQKSEIILSARASGERVFIEIESINDSHAESAGKESDDGNAIDLSMCRRGIEASKGILRVRKILGSGEMFTIDLLRHLSA